MNLTSGKRSSVENNWRPLVTDMYKINCDAMVDESNGIIGFGIVIRDYTGFVLVSCSQKIVATCTAQVAETVAIYRGIEFAKDCGLGPYVLESDAAVAVKWINERSYFNSACGVILFNISKLISEQGGISI
ncbi:hypothetical protein Dsin_005410 [Dipteronia sinensis]|uniref:RNase H type-1 domain-containing protein n=1 Tax=Dipteronia sinensis TaxID=43782 RepID=A0AAE0EEL1_9ROSI|nr:hypothetical protein Dsin_005410 [Dipteronia sinensis]